MSTHTKKHPGEHTTATHEGEHTASQTAAAAEHTGYEHAVKNVDPSTGPSEPAANCTEKAEKKERRHIEPRYIERHKRRARSGRRRHLG
jgi:hypothetical protein